MEEIACLITVVVENLLLLVPRGTSHLPLIIRYAVDE